jgi:hypothetical protein
LGFVIAGAVTAPAALARPPQTDDLADLTVSQTTDMNNIQEPHGPVTYQLTVKNPGIQVWDPELHRYFPGGAPPYGVVVRDYLPGGSQFLSISADSGFSCSQASGIVTCSGGTVLRGGTAHVTINTNAPPVMGAYGYSAVVDPNNTIAERSEGNNTTSASLTVVYLN